MQADSTLTRWFTKGSTSGRTDVTESGQRGEGSVSAGKALQRSRAGRETFVGTLVATL